MIADIYALSPVQAAMLFHRVFAPESTAYFDQFSCRLTGAVDPELLRCAWQQLVDRHPVLRTSFHWEGLEKPVQVVHTQVALPWDALDWRGAPPAEQAARWQAYLDADRAHGFNPEVAPLMRAAIVRVTDRDYYFCWSHHHLLLDGWCLAFVLSELFARYQALKEGRVPQLAPARPYADYIKWLQHRDRDALERYWRDGLRGFTTPTPIIAPAGRERPGPARVDATAELQLSTGLSDELRALSASRRLTLNTLVQGAWALLLARYSGTDDVVFGTTVSGRPPDLPGVETMLGVFINTVPVRVPLDGSATAATWLAGIQARHVTREAFAAIPLSDIQKLSDVEPGTPLFDSNVIVLNFRMEQELAGGAAGLEIHDVRVFDQTDVPLTLQVTPGPRMTLEIAYDSARFDAGAVTRMLGHVEHLLAQFRDGLDRPLAAFEVVTASERAQILDQFNATDAPLDRSRSAVDVWREQAAATPDAIAVECDGRRLSFRELDDWSTRLSLGLRTLATPGLPLGPDALVAIAFRRSERLIAAILAIWKCGAGYVPIDPDYPPDRIRQVLDTASPRLVLRDAGTLETVEAGDGGATRFASISDVEQASDNAGSTALDQPSRELGGDLAYVIFTSGSTGQPKGAMVEQVGMVNHLLAKIEDFHLDSRSVIVQNASHCFDVSVWQCFAAMLAGGRTLVYTDALVHDPARFLERVRADRVTVLEVVPSYLAALLDCFEDDPRPFADLRQLVVTGETVKAALVERWFSLCPSIPMVNAYGPTEASDDITHAFMTEPPATPTVPVGRPLRNFHIYIVDEQLRLCPIGVPGELCVSGAGVGRGYLRDPEKTAAVFLEDPFRRERGVRMYRTGDIGWFTEDGVILLAGRKDHQVKVRGYRIELGDIEAALAGLEAVRDAAVVERRDRGAGSGYLAAYVTLTDAPATPAQILGALAARLPDYMIPATCTVLESLPLTPNGKIDRKALPAPERVADAADAPPAAPGTDAERALAAVWADVLGVEQPGIHDNFFAAGGDSILSMQLVARASRAGLELTPRDVFQHQTIAALAAAARPSGTRLPAPGRQASGPAPLAPAQRQFFADVVVDRHHYNQSILLEVPAGFDAERCERALGEVVRHHEALRLRFSEIDGIWRQSVAPAEPGPLLAIHPLPGMSANQRASAVDDLGGLVQASLDITRGPLIRAAYFDHESSAPGRLLIVAHHLAVDGVSWRVLLEDLASVYDALGQQAPVTLPPVTAGYLDWVATIDETTPIVDTAPALTAIGVPTDAPLDERLNTVASSAELTVDFDEATTRGFLTLTSQAYQAGPTALLLAATGLALAEWTGLRQVHVDLETHGRDGAGLDVTRTVGWFTSTFPVRLDLPDLTADVAGAVASAAAQLRRAAAVPAQGPRPAFLLNYHGRIDADSRGEWRLSPDAHGPDRSPRQGREYLVEINGLISGGRLRLTLGFSRHLHRDATMRALAHHLEKHLAAIVDGARSQSALGALLARSGDVDDVYDLSPTQQGLLFHGLVDDTKGAYFNQLTCVIDGALDAGTFAAAWQAVTARHPVLRTSFHWQGLERPVQIVHARAEIPWVVEDWREVPAAESARRWQHLGEEDRRRPFDVSAPPLMRCALVRTGETTYRFRWSQHHLLLDGWSSSIVLNDVLGAYEAMVAGRQFDPPPAPAYRDHIHWLQQQDQAAAESFWRRQLDGFESPTPLVIGLPEMEGQVQTGCFGEAETVLPGALAARLKAIAAANHVTLNTLFQGVWAMLLGRYGGQGDVVFGAIQSGRSPALAGSGQMVGVFINTVPVRARLENEAPIFDWLRALQQENAERDAWSYSSLADVQRASAVPGGTPLFETILIFENYPVAATLEASGRSLSIAQVEAVEPNNYPMTFVVTPGESIGLKIMFDAGRFDRATIDRALGHVTTLLTGIADAPDARLGALPIMTAAERARIDTWNRTAKELPRGETVASLIEAHARQAPHRVAVTCDGRRVTYGELNARANQLARLLEASGGVARDARAVVVMRRSARLPETILALWKCGAAYVPVDPEYPAERIATIVADARPALVIDGTGRDEGTEAGGWREAARRQGVPLVRLDESEDARAAHDAANLDRPREVAALAYVIYTSGSTGAPKGAMLEHGGLLNHVLSMIDDLALGPASVVAQTASHCFDISMWQLFAALVAGGTTAIYPDAVVRRPERLAARLEADGVTAAQFVPSYLNVFLDALDGAAERPALAALAHMVVIGEALKPATIGRWCSRYPGIPLMNAYGPTEASDSVAHFEITAPVGGAMVPIGRPIQNMALHVVDSVMRQCPVGVRGEICIAGVGVGRGYLFDEARTRAAFLPNPFSDGGGRLYRTGDIGCRRADGALLFLGRRDHQVKIRGHRIELGEIESCLASVAGVRDAAVVTRDGAGGDLVLCAYVTAQAGSALDEEGVRQRLSEQLPSHAVPDTIRVLPEMPVMANGKVDRRSLAALAVARPAAGGITEPLSATEQALARIWSDVLEHSGIGVDQSFFDLGGHSLKAIQIVSRITRECGVETGVGDLFERRTIRALAELIDTASKGGGSDLVAIPDQDLYETSAMQKRLWLASRTPEGSSAYNMAGAFWLDGMVDPAALARAFRALSDRHEALRTVFVVAAGTLRQRVLDAAGNPFRDSDRTSLGDDPAALDAAIAARILAPFDLARGPLFDAELMRCSGGRSLLLVRLHHIVGDAASIRILLREALALYAAFRRGDTDPALPPLTIQYRDFAAWQNRLGTGDARARSRQYWLDTLGPQVPRTGFPPDISPAAPATDGIAVKCDLDEGLSARLRALAGRHETTLFAVIVSAVYGLLYRYTGQQDVTIGSTVSRRDHPLLEDQVGCYIDTLVLRGRVDGGDTAAALVTRAARVCRGALAHRDYPFESLLDDLRLPAPRGQAPLFDVLVDYVPGSGAMAGPAADAGLVIEERPLAVEAAHYDTMFLVAEPDSGTSLSVQLVFNAGLFSAEAVALARTRLLAMLEWLAADGDEILGAVELLGPAARPRRRLHISLNTD